MTEEERIRALLEAMKQGSPGGPIMGGMGFGGFGRITGAPGVAAGVVRGGFTNRAPGRGALAFSPYAAQVAMGKNNLAAPTQPPGQVKDGGGPAPGAPAPGFYGSTPAATPPPAPSGSPAPAPVAPTPPPVSYAQAGGGDGYLDYTGGLSHANYLRLLRLGRGQF